MTSRCSQLPPATHDARLRSRRPGTCGGFDRSEGLQIAAQIRGMEHALRRFRTRGRRNARLTDLRRLLGSVLRLQHDLAEHPAVGQGLQRGTALRERITLWRWRFQPSRHQLVQTPGEQRRRTGHLMQVLAPGDAEHADVAQQQPVDLDRRDRARGKPMTSSLPSMANTRIASSKAGPPTGSTTMSTPAAVGVVAHRLRPAVGQRQHHVGAQRLDEIRCARAMYYAQ